jgi:CRP-like cAMP-binding protein
MAEKNLLHNVYLFKQMTAEEVLKINQVAVVQIYAPGDEVFNEGDPATAMFVIRYGSVRIFQNSKDNDKVEVALLGTGSHFGEMAFIDQEPRSASAITVEKTELVRLDYEKLKEVLQKHPVIAVKFFESLSHFLCGRLRITTKDLSFARERNLQYF